MLATLTPTPAADRALATGILQGPLHPDPGPGLTPGSGMVFAANDSRFIASNYSVPLTAYSVGWNDPNNLDALLEQIAPSIESAERFTFKLAENAEAFLSETDDIRAIGSAFKRVEFTDSEVDGRVFNKGLTIRVDNDEQVGSDWQERYTGYLLQRLTRNDLRRAVAGLSAAATAVALTWDGDSNPDGTIRDQLRTAKYASGLRPNRALFGGLAWDMRADAYEANQTNAAKFLLGSKTSEEVRLKLMLDALVVSEAVYGANDGTKSDIVGNIVLLYFAQSGVTKDDPSNIKRFVYKTAQGFYRVYVQTFNKFVEITVEHYSREYITSPLGIRQLNITGIS